MPAPSQDTATIRITAAPTVSLDRSEEWKRCCVDAMGFEWVDKFEKDESRQELKQQQQRQPIQQIISLLDDDAMEDDDFILDDDDDDYRDDSENSQQHLSRTDAWMESALRIQADLNRMSNWIQSKQQEYVGLDMKDDEASLIQSTVTSFAATTASELETLRKMIGSTSSNSNLANHRSGIVQILLEQLQQQVTTPFGILQKQRTRVAVQLWQNPLQCKLYTPSLRKRRPRSNSNDLQDILFDDDQEDAQPKQKEQRFLPRHVDRMEDDEALNFISKYAHKPSTRIPPEPPAFLTRLAKRQKQSRHGMGSSTSSASNANNEPSSKDESSTAFSLLRPKQNTQQPSIPQPHMPPMNYEQQLAEDLQEETMQLSTQLIASNELDSVQQMETRMVEITTLIGQFSNLVQEQQEQVMEVHEASRSTKENMDKGQENLVDATERTKQSKHYKAWIIFGMAMVLLFFHTLRN